MKRIKKFMLTLLVVAAISAGIGSISIINIDPSFLSSSNPSYVNL